MKYFFLLSAVALAVSATPVPLEGDYDPSRQPGAFTTNPNYTNARVPWGQSGFAAAHGGTYGGNGGAVWTVWDSWALRDALNGDERREVRIRGRIDLTQLFTGSPGVAVNVGSYKTVVGEDANAVITGGGLRIFRVLQVIVRNLKIHNSISYAPGEQPNGNGGIISQNAGAYSVIDNIGVEGSEYVWIDHCELADDPFVQTSIPENRRRHDGLLDIVQGSNWISVSNTIFRNHDFVSLVGNDDNNWGGDNGRLKVTWYLNWFQAVNQRMPRVRFGEVHVMNNLYTNIRTYGIGVGTASSIYVERNAFVRTRRAWALASPNPMGFLLNVENRFTSSSFDSGIQSSGVTWRPNQYYPYVAMDPAQVEAHVRNFAGPR